jgi:mannose-6-phosphate isomerase-like protein (cupin superfamily)
MTDRFIAADLAFPADVYGVHGAHGFSRWKCLARQPLLRGPWEAVEWAWLPPGGVSGEHKHTRTEELYYIVSGRGRILLNGVASDVGTGDLILTPVGTTHGLRNVGEAELSWLVVELRAGAAVAAYAAAALGNPVRSISESEPIMSEPLVTHLGQVGECDPRTVLSGPLKEIRVAELAPGQAETLVANDAEHTLFVLAGSGNASDDKVDVQLSAGTAITLPLGTRVSLSTTVGLRFFHASLTVPQRSGATS